MKLKYIKIFGERNTGTNYFSKLIERNLTINVLPGTVPDNAQNILSVIPGKELLKDLYFKHTILSNFGWKHREVDHIDEIRRSKISRQTLFITITKNPYSWLLSLYRRPYHNHGIKGMTFDKFLETKWNSLGRESNRMFYADPVDLWNKKNASYLSLDKEFEVMHVNYEHVLINPEKIISGISDSFKLETKSGFTNYENSTKEETKDNEYYRKYYGEELWKKELSKKNIELINSGLDKKLMNVYKYDFM
jgi:hypothetical protein